MLKENIEYITQLNTQSDVDLNWDQINATIEAILSEKKLRQRRLKSPKERRNRRESSKVTVEILPHGARRIKMNWNYAERYRYLL